MTPNGQAIALAWQHFRAGNLAETEAICRPIVDADPKDVDARYLLGAVCQTQGRIPECIPLYEQCLRIKPNMADVQNNLGIAYALVNRPGDAMACYQEAVRLKPDHGEALNNVGLLQAQQGELTNAVASFRRALAAKPQYADALFNLGTAHMRLNQIDEAVRCFQQTLALRPNHAETLDSLGDAYLAQDKWADAGNCYMQSLRLRPDNPKAFNNLARVYANLQKWPEAVACLQQSVAYSPNNPLPLRNLGNLYYFRSDWVNALPCYERALELAPEDKNVRLLVDVLRGTARFAQVPADSLRSIYEPFASQFDEEIVRRGYRSPEFLKAALEPAPASRSLNILDLGCGTGLCGLQFRDWAETLVGVDLSPNMLAYARNRGVYDELIVGDLFTEVRQWQSKFDLIVASDVMLFFGDLEPLTRAVRQALRPGGRFAFTADIHEGTEDYHLTPFIHFAHSRAYLQSVAQTIDVREICMKQVGPPSGLSQGALGLVVIWSRP